MTCRWKLISDCYSVIQNLNIDINFKVIVSHSNDKSTAELVNRRRPPEHNGPATVFGRQAGALSSCNACSNDVKDFSLDLKDAVFYLLSSGSVISCRNVVGRFVNDIFKIISNQFLLNSRHQSSHFSDWKFEGSVNFTSSDWEGGDITYIVCCWL